MIDYRVPKRKEEVYVFSVEEWANDERKELEKIAGGFSGNEWHFSHIEVDHENQEVKVVYHWFPPVGVKPDPPIEEYNRMLDENGM